MNTAHDIGIAVRFARPRLAADVDRDRGLGDTRGVTSRVARAVQAARRTALTLGARSVSDRVGRGIDGSQLQRGGWTMPTWLLVLIVVLVVLALFGGFGYSRR